MTIEDFEELAAPEGFRPFVVVTKSGWSIKVPHPEFVAIPPQPASYIIVYTARAHVPQLVDLDAIDHIEYQEL
jgi:hypothetical protein